jgi:hypothetical protein
MGPLSDVLLLLKLLTYAAAGLDAAGQRTSNRDA